MAAAKKTESEPLTGAARAELMRLRKQVHELARNNEFLGKASAYLSTNPPKRSELL